MTGCDITKIEGRNKIRKLYDYTELRYQTNQLAKKTIITDGIKNLYQIIMGVGVMIAIYLGWTK